MAFYTDCVHEVKPVTAGFRVALIYNLYRLGGRQSPAKCASIHESAVSDVKEPSDAMDAPDEEKPPSVPVLGQRFAMDVTRLLCLNPAQAVGWFCEYRYARASLQLAHLKGSDATLCQALRSVLGARLVDKATRSQSLAKRQQRKLILFLTPIVVKDPPRRPRNEYDVEVARAEQLSDGEGGFDNYYANRVRWMNADALQGCEHDDVQAFDSGKDQNQPCVFFVFVEPHCFVVDDSFFLLSICI